MHRNNDRAWQSTAAAYVLASCAGGLLSGVVLGSIGAALPTAARLGLTLALSSIALLITMFALVGWTPAPLQRSCETPKPWADADALGWAVRNGLTLGCGATTRVGFWSWYLVPAVALLSGDVLAGALSYGAYGIARAGAGALLFARMRAGADDIGLWMVRQYRPALLIARIQLFAAAAIGLFGLVR